jgi:hypothetical protein
MARNTSGSDVNPWSILNFVVGRLFQVRQHLVPHLGLCVLGRIELVEEKNVESATGRDERFIGKCSRVELWRHRWQQRPQRGCAASVFLEYFDRLRAPVFDNRKVGRLEMRHRFPLGVDHRHVNDDKVGAGAQGGCRLNRSVLRRRQQRNRNQDA